jgi:phthalate 4,5-cis-dihydrodiol dehydrogenase
VAGADPREPARAAFERAFGGEAFTDAETLCRSPKIDLVYICTPPLLHREQAEIAAAHRKHILVEKPMALTAADCDAMIATARKAGVALIYGHSHAYDPPIRALRDIVRSGRYGTVAMLHNWTYTDLLYRARAAWELDTGRGGGVVYIQAPHQIDIARLLAARPVESVCAHTICLDETRAADGAFSALLSFEGGASASLAYSGYGRFDSAELHGWIGEDGHTRPAGTHAATHRARKGRDEQNAREARRFGGSPAAVLDPPHHSFFGMTLVSLTGADIRQTPKGLAVYTDRGREDIDVPVRPSGREIMFGEVHAAITRGESPLHDGWWGRETVAVCVAILEASRTRRVVRLAN